ncbi:hypothetical protein Tco_0686749 [Tanacetum coccineum]
MIQKPLQFKTAVVLSDANGKGQKPMCRSYSSLDPCFRPLDLFGNHTDCQRGNPCDVTLYFLCVNDLSNRARLVPGLLYKRVRVLEFGLRFWALDPAYADADHAGCQDTRRSTSGSAQFLRDKLVSWSSKKQKSIAISSIEAEFIALSGYYAQIL